MRLASAILEESVSICPADGKPCMDDMCHGAGCIRMDGYEMLEICEFCKGIIDSEISECSTCVCDQDEYQDVE